MKNNLYLFTDEYPHGNSETFVHNEIPYLAASFERVIITPLFFKNKLVDKNLPANVYVNDSFLSCRRDEKFKLLFLGLFNFSSTKIVFKEFYLKKAYKNLAHFKNWIEQSCILRAVLASQVFRKGVVSKINCKSVFYFYWAYNTANVVSYMKKSGANPIIMRFHRADLYETREKRKGYLAFRDSICDSVDLAVFISSHGMNYAKTNYPLPSYKTVVSKLGISSPGFINPSCSSESEFVLVSCSGIVPVKRVHRIAESLLYVDFKLRWIHFGDGFDKCKLESVIEKFPANICVELKGRVPNHDVFVFYKENHVDLFINLSESEGVPVSIMEAQSVGLPVLATNVGGTSEIVKDAVNGYLVEKEDEPSRIAYLLKEHNMLSVKECLLMRENARNNWENDFNAETNYRRFIELINSLVT